MNSDKVVDYVLKTPQNTNPTILKQIIQEAVQNETLAAAMAYTDSKRFYNGEIIDVTNQYDETVMSGKIGGDTL